MSKEESDSRRDESIRRKSNHKGWAVVRSMDFIPSVMGNYWRVLIRTMSTFHLYFKMTALAAG